MTSDQNNMKMSKQKKKSFLSWNGSVDYPYFGARAMVFRFTLGRNKIVFQMPDPISQSKPNWRQ